MGSSESKSKIADAVADAMPDPNLGTAAGPKANPADFFNAPVAKPEYAKLKSVHKKKPGSQDNVIHDVYNDDLDNVDHNMSSRIPPVVRRDFNSKAYSEAGRPCYELEKTMARCIQDKMWTAWKCQKERDTYYKCLHLAEEDSSVIQKFRWKYNTGVYPGEVVARNHIMNTLWKEYFPDRELPHLWAEQ